MVRADEAHGVWVLESSGNFRTWYRGAAARVPGSYPHSVAGPLRPPDAYLALAALGVLVGALALVEDAERALGAGQLAAAATAADGCEARLKRGLTGTAEDWSASVETAQSPSGWRSSQKGG